MRLDDYRADVALDHPRSIAADADWRRSIVAVADQLQVDTGPDEDPSAALRAVRDHLAVLEPRTLTDPLVDRIEAINVAVTAEAGTIDVHDLPTLAEQQTFRPSQTIADVVSLVVADITRLRADAIVNAANRRLLGCQVPGHPCIDNAIHSAAGPRLRDDCATIVAGLGGLDATGTARITRAHALPGRYVLHTAGPQLVPGSPPSAEERRLLAQCYRACLVLAAEVDDIRSIAFCGIATGVFAFPPDQAAVIAIDTITEWVAANPGRFDRLVIDCYSEPAAGHYHRALGAGR
ncbi:MAG: macro domain-containing protein [Actinomycetota bacterium]